MWRTWVRLILASVVLLSSVADAKNPWSSKGRGRSGTTLPPPADIGYIENLNTRIVATDAYRPSSGNAAGTNTRISTAAGTDYYVLTYMDNKNGPTIPPGTIVNGPHDQYPIKCSYLTGTCDKGPSLGLKDPTCCDGHDVGGPFVDPLDGKIIGFYGALDAATRPSAPSDGPFYKISTNAGDISSWGSETRAPASGSISELMGGFDSSGDFFGCGQSQWGGAYGRAFALRCIKRVSGTWSAITLVEVGSNNGTQGSSGDPGCVPFVRVYPNGEVYVMWERSFTGCSGANTDLFFVKSTDKTEFCNVAGASCFTPTVNTGLQSTWNGTSHDYPDTYAVINSSGMAAESFHADKLGDGTPFVIYGRSGNTYFRKYVAGWTAEVLAASGEGSPGCLLVKPNGDIKFYTGFTNIDEFTSTNNGANWSSARIHTLGDSGETGNRRPGCRYYANLGGKPRIILTWNVEINSTTASAVATRDLPQ